MATGAAETKKRSGKAREPAIDQEHLLKAYHECC